MVDFRITDIVNSISNPIDGVLFERQSPMFTTAATAYELLGYSDNQSVRKDACDLFVMPFPSIPSCSESSIEGDETMNLAQDCI